MFPYSIKRAREFRKFHVVTACNDGYEMYKKVNTDKIFKFICLLEFAIVLKLKNNKKNFRGKMHWLQMNPPRECGLINLINSHLAFSFFHFSTTTLLQLGVSSRCLSPFHADECVFSLNEQQKVYNNLFPQCKYIKICIHIVHAACKLF